MKDDAASASLQSRSRRRRDAVFRLELSQARSRRFARAPTHGTADGEAFMRAQVAFRQRASKSVLSCVAAQLRRLSLAPLVHHDQLRNRVVSSLHGCSGFGGRSFPAVHRQGGVALVLSVVPVRSDADPLSSHARTLRGRDVVPSMLRAECGLRGGDDSFRDGRVLRDAIHRVAEIAEAEPVRPLLAGKV